MDGKDTIPSIHHSDSEASCVDDDVFGINRQDFFESIHMEKWAHLFDPFLLPDKTRICLAWLHDATARNFEQLGVTDTYDIDCIRHAIRDKLTELEFDFEDVEEKGITTSKKLSSKSNPTRVSSKMKSDSSKKSPTEFAAVDSSPGDKVSSDHFINDESNLDSELLFKHRTSR